MTQADALQREHALAEGIAEIAATGDLVHVARASCKLTRKLIGDTAWAALLLGGIRSLVVEAVDGLSDHHVGERVAPQEWPLPIRAGLSAGQSVLWPGPPGALGLGAPLPAGASDTRASCSLIVPLTLRGSLTGALVAGGDSPQLDAARPSLGILATHVAVTHNSLGAVDIAETVLEQTEDLVFVLDAAGTIRRANTAACRALGRPSDAVTGEPLLSLVDTSAATALVDSLSRLTVGAEAAARFELSLRHAQGGRIDVEAAARRVKVDAADGFVVTATDVRERRNLEGELSHRAFHDPLTNLANRTLLSERIRDAVARRRGQELALLMIDLDDFKGINDSFGHHEGDRVLVQVAQRIRKTVRSADTVARFGGDEFFVLVDDTSEPEIASMAARLLEALGDPYPVAGTNAHVHASIGIRLAGRREAAAVDQLIRDADLAMYAAKEQGKATWALYHPPMHDRACAELALRSELRLGIERREFLVYYQPVVDLSSGRLVGTEALVRWAHPTRGLLSPNEFIPMAEATGMIVELGAWVLDEACRQTAAWRVATPASPPSINVNLSPRQLVDRGVVTMVAAAVDRHQLPPHALALEITESMMANDNATSRSAIASLDALGVRIHIDDFGTGYSALGYLGSLPVDAIKIDRSFVAGIAGTNEEASVAKAICHIAQMMNLTPVAEGVERPEQARRLLDLGCTLGQGYLYAPPLAPEGIEPWLARTTPFPRLAASSARA